MRYLPGPGLQPWPWAVLVNPCCPPSTLTWRALRGSAGDSIQARAAHAGQASLCWQAAWLSRLAHLPTCGKRDPLWPLTLLQAPSRPLPPPTSACSCWTTTTSQAGPIQQQPGMLVPPAWRAAHAQQLCPRRRRIERWPLRRAFCCTAPRCWASNPTAPVPCTPCRRGARLPAAQLLAASAQCGGQPGLDPAAQQQQRRRQRAQRGRHCGHLCGRWVLPRTLPWTRSHAQAWDREQLPSGVLAMRLNASLLNMPANCPWK